MNTPTQPPAAGEAAYTREPFDATRNPAHAAHVLSRTAFPRNHPLAFAAIVRACNSHAALVEALNWAVGYFDDPHRVLDSRQLDKARAALEQARKP